MLHENVVVAVEVEDVEDVLVVELEVEADALFEEDEETMAELDVLMAELTMELDEVFVVEVLFPLRAR